MLGFRTVATDVHLDVPVVLQGCVIVPVLCGAQMQE